MRRVVATRIPLPNPGGQGTLWAPRETERCLSGSSLRTLRWQACTTTEVHTKPSTSSTTRVLFPG